MTQLKAIKFNPDNVAVALVALGKDSTVNIEGEEVKLVAYVISSC